MKGISAILVLTLAQTVQASAQNIKEAWPPFSDPNIMSHFFNRTFAKLPLSGSVHPSNKLWSGDYWALAKGNINYRWYAKNKIGFNLNSPTRANASKMTIPQLAELAPSEKYDLFTGRYDYPLKNEVNKIANPNANIWEGICHGWSPATSNHNEPVAKLMTNPDGIEIPFGSTDIKALISYYYAHGHQTSNSHQMGYRCFKGSFANNDPDCNEDLNAGAFHLILANRIGVDGKSFIADIERYEQIWNHPITAYASKVLTQSIPDHQSAPGTVTTLGLQTIITYLDENGKDWHPVKGTSKQEYKNLIYNYKLDLDAQGNVIGGNWLSKQRPDFLWLIAKPRQFEGTLARLSELLNDDN